MAFDPEFPNDKAVREAVERAAEVRAQRMAQSKAAPLDRAVSSGPPRRDGVRNDAAFEALKQGKAAAAQPWPSDVPRPEDAPRPGAPTVKRPQFNMPSPEKAIADLVRDIDTTARVAAGTASSMASFPMRTLDTAYNNIRGEFDGRPRREYEGPLHNAMLTFARETPPVSSPQAAAPGAVSAGRGRPKIARAGMDATPLGGAVAARNYDGSVMTSGEGTPVYQGRATFGGVEQPVFTDSPYDPLLAGKAGKEAAAFLQANPKLRDAHIKAMQPVQDRMKRRADAVAAAGPQYSLAELGTVANAQKTLAEAEKIKSATSIAADANSRLNREASLKAEADNNAMLKSIMDSGQAATPEEALMIALQSPNFAPAVSSAVEAADRRSREALRGAFDSGWNIWENNVGGNVIPGYEGSISGLSPDQINYEDFELSEAPGMSRFWDSVTPDFQGIGGTHSLKWKGPVEEGMTQPTSMLNASEAKEVQRWLEMQRLLRSRKNTGG